MRQAMAGTFLMALLALASGQPIAAAPFSDLVAIDSGRLRGAVQDDVLSFKGIPFAAPPVGDLRWRPPQAAAPWTGVRPAVAYGSDCMQKPFGGDAAPLGTAPAEDCLVLNVWRPARASAGKLPVMVWIYGGGNVNGGSSPAVYDGSAFARRGIVFVSFNYRLGRFGFFAHPALTAQTPAGPLGNYGYMDMIAALQWVKRNIGAFGGDARNVTVVGESAGGAAVHVLMTSPEARGLFAKAIVESGGGRSLLGPMLDLKTAEAAGVSFAHAMGIEGGGPDALAALRALPADKIVNGLDLVALFNPAQRKNFAGPMIDGKIVVETPEQAYLAGHAAKVPMIVGANSADIGYSMAKTVDEALAPYGASLDAAKLAYDPGNSGEARAVGSRAMMDQMMVEPARFVARTVSAGGRPAYEYRFSYVADSMRGEWKTGAPHASEIPYVFDTVNAKYGAKLVPEDEAVARSANGYWANFAKTGNPNGAGLPRWPAYSAAKDMLLDFTAAGEPAAARDPWKARLDLTAALAGKAE
jgi:para-nitrobenzyl esterase